MIRLRSTARVSLVLVAGATVAAGADAPGIERIDVRASDDPAVAAHRSGARISVAVGGATASATVSEPLGNPANPVDDQALEAKFRGLAEPVIGRQAASRLAQMVWTFGEASRASGEEDGLAFLRDLAPARAG